jgi:phosphoribosyl 1,2-cyclic phosphodiesterase
MSLSVRLLSSGSGGNVGVVAVDEPDGSRFELLIDAGLPVKHLLARAGALRPRAVLVTHDHSDHIRFAAEYARRFQIPVYGTPGTLAYAELSRVERRVLSPGKAAAIGPVEVRPFETPHDATEPVGLVISCRGSALGWATDLGEAPKAVEEALAGCDAAVLEMNHDPEMLARGPYPASLKRRVGGRFGHLSNAQGADLLARVASRGRLALAILAHLSETNNTPDRAERAALEALSGKKVALALAEQRRPVGPFRVIGPQTQLSLF